MGQGIFQDFPATMIQGQGYGLCCDDTNYFRSSVWTGEYKIDLNIKLCVEMLFVPIIKTCIE